MGQGHPAHPGVVRRRAPGRAGREPGRASTSPAMARLFEAYEEVKTERGVIDFEDVLLLTVGILAEREDIARTVRGQYRHFVVDEYQDVNAAPAAAARPVARRARRPLRRRRPGPDHLLLHRRLARAPARLPRPRIPRRAGRRAGAQLPLHAAGRRPRQPSSLRGTGGQRRAGAVRAGRAARPPARRPSCSSRRRRPGRGRRGRRAHRARWSPAGTRPAEIAVLFRTNAQSEAFESALADAGVPYLVRGGERFFARKEVREAILLLRGAARGDDGDDAAAASSPATSSRGAGWTPAAARQRRRGPRALGVAAGLAALADDLAAAAPEARLPELVARARRARRRAARARPSGRHPGLAARGQGPGVGRRLPRRLLRRAAARSRMADGPAAVEEERRLLYVGVTRARERPAAVVVAAPAPPAAGPPAPVALPRRRGRRPRRGRPLAAEARAGGAGAGAGQGRARRRALPQLRRRADHRRRSARSAAATTARPPTTRRRSRRCARGGWPSRARPSVPAFVVFTDATLTAIAERKPADVAAARHDHRRRGRASSSAYGDAVLRSWVVPTRTRSPKTLLPQRNPRRSTRPTKSRTKVQVNYVAHAVGAALA